MNFNVRQMLCVCIFLCLSFTTLAHTGATGIIKERMDFFSRSKDNLRAIKSYLKVGDLDSITPLAKEIRDWAIKMPDYFPKGSDGKPSEASPKIWVDFENFVKSAKANQVAAQKLFSATEKGDLSESIGSFKELAATCKSCHKVYRIE